MLKRFRKYFIANYEKIKLSMSLTLGITALILLVFYLIGCFLNLWTYNIIDLVFNPIAGSIIVVVPIYILIIMFRFFNCYWTRGLFYRIIKTHRRRINFTLQEDMGRNPECETHYKLNGEYRESVFRFTYSIGHPLRISLISEMRGNDIILLNRILKQFNLKRFQINRSGMTFIARIPFRLKIINTIPEILEMLIDNSMKIMRSAETYSGPDMQA